MTPPASKPLLEKVVELEQELRVTKEVHDCELEKLRTDFDAHHTRIGKLHDADTIQIERLAALEKGLQEQRAWTEQFMNVSAEKLRAAVLEQAASFDSSLEARVLDALRKEFAAGDSQALGAALHHTDESVAKAMVKAEERLEAARRDLDERREELRRRVEAGLQAAAEHRQALGARLLSRITEVEEASRRALVELGAALRSEAAEIARRAKEHADRGLARLEAAMNEKDAVKGQQIHELQEDSRRCFDKLDHHDERLNVNAQEIRRVRNEARAELAKAVEERDRKFQLVDAAVERTQESCDEVAGVSTKRVEWKIEDALDRLERFRKGEDADGGVWRSPKFCAGGGRSLQLELRVSNGDEPESPSGADAKNDRRYGDCSLSLYACDGLRLSFRMFAGSSSENLKHVFDGGAPCSVLRMFTFGKEVSPMDGALTVGVEVFDASRDHVFRLPSFAEAQGEAVDGAMDEGEQLSCTKSAVQLGGSLLRYQYLNNRLLEYVQAQHRRMLEVINQKVALLRSRAVRRVQWRLEGSAFLRRTFPEGRPVCSAPFTAAGISGLQFIFYPSGCQGARDGFCSLFLLCPPGCAMRCWLWAGRWRREARRETQRQELLGRANFCRFEGCEDPVDESVEIAVEIEDAHVLTNEAAASSAAVPAALPAMMSELADDRPATGVSHSSSSKAPDIDRVDVSTRRLERERRPPASPSLQASSWGAGGGGTARMLAQQEQVEQLPPIWTSQGFNNFADIQHGRDRLGASRGSTTGGSGDCAGLGSVVVSDDASALPPSPQLPPATGGTAFGLRPPTSGSGGNSGGSSARGTRPGRRSQGACASASLPAKYSAYASAVA